MTQLPFDLAKSLSDSGWPQVQDKAGGSWLFGKDAMQTQVYSPSLSELIAACGDGFDELYRLHDGFIATGGYLSVIRTDAYSTPEEAVARLWLQLKSKDRK